MYKEVLDYFEKAYGSFNCSLMHELYVADDGSKFENILLVGDEECWDGWIGDNKYYQYMITNDKVFMVYYDLIDPETGEMYDDLVSYMECMDYSRADWIKDVTDEYVHWLVPEEKQMQPVKSKVFPPPK